MSAFGNHSMCLRKSAPSTQPDPDFRAAVVLNDIANRRGVKRPASDDTTMQRMAPASVVGAESSRAVKRTPNEGQHQDKQVAPYARAATRDSAVHLQPGVAAARPAPVVVASLQERVTTLREKLWQTTAENAHLIRENTVLRSNIDHLTAQIDSLNGLISSQGSELSATHRDIELAKDSADHWFHQASRNRMAMDLMSRYIPPERYSQILRQFSLPPF